MSQKLSMQHDRPHRPSVAGRFAKYVRAGFPASELLPIMPPGTKLRQKSGSLEGRQGKIPGVYHADDGTWSGMGDWTTRDFDLNSVTRWEHWKGNPSVGLQTRIFVAADLDVDDPAVKAFEEAIVAHLGYAPVRGRSNSLKILLV